MGKDYSALALLATTGAGIAIGGTSAIALGSIFRASDLAGTFVLKSGTTTVLTMSSARDVHFAVPVRVAGPVTMTSSAGGSFLVSYRKL